MTPQPRSATAPIAPALVAAALDCLAVFPDGHRLEPSLLIAITRTLGADTREADALLVRIRAAAIVMRDARWPNWAAHLRCSCPDRRRSFDAIVLDCVAALPLDDALSFSADTFFDTLLACLPAGGRH